MANDNSDILFYDELQRCVKNYTSCPTLEQISLTRIAISLWTTNETKTAITRYFSDPAIDRQEAKEWRRIEKEIMRKSKHLVHPIFEENFESIVANLSAQIYEWVKYLGKYILTPITVSKDYVNEIAWTIYGTIDKEKTFNLLLNNDTLQSNESLHRLGHCLLLKDEIMLMEDRLPALAQPSVENEQVIDDNVISDVNDFCSRENVALSSMESSLLMTLLELGNDVTAKNCRNLSSQTWKFNFIIRDVLTTFNIDLFYFLLTHSSKDELKSLILEDPSFVLRGLAISTRPWQVYLRPFAETIIPLLKFEDFLMVMIDMLLVILTSGLDGLAVKRFFMFLWEKADQNVRRMIFCNGTLWDMLSEWNWEFLKDVLEYANDELIWWMLSDEKGKFRCLRAVISEEFSVGEFLESILKREDLVGNYKNELARYGFEKLLILLIGNKYKMFFRWCLTDENEIVRVKKRFCTYHVVETTVTAVNYDAIDSICDLMKWKIGESHIDIDDFLKWSSLSEDEVSRLKRKYYDTRERCVICSCLLQH